MVMQWKQYADVYQAAWQNIHFTLFENPQSHRWQLTADGKLVGQTWPKAHAAMTTIENRQQALIMRSHKAFVGKGVAHGASA